MDGQNRVWHRLARQRAPRPTLGQGQDLRFAEHRVDISLVHEVLRADLLRAQLAFPNPAADGLGIPTDTLRGFGNGQHSCMLLHVRSSRPGERTAGLTECYADAEGSSPVRLGAHIAVPTVRRTDAKPSLTLIGRRTFVRERRGSARRSRRAPDAASGRGTPAGT